jgi:hypothetical protein
MIAALAVALCIPVFMVTYTRGWIHCLDGPEETRVEQVALMDPRQARSTSLRSAFALAALLVVASVAPGCSMHQDSSPQLGTAEDYLAQRQNNAYAYSYAPYDLCTAYDPYCFAPYWYPAPVYYYLSGDGDNDCDDGNCDGFRGAGHHRPPAGSRVGRNPPATAASSATFAAAPHGFGIRVPSPGSAHFGGSFGRGAFGGHGHR